MTSLVATAYFNTRDSGYISMIFLYDFFYGPIVPEINYSSILFLLLLYVWRGLVVPRGLILRFVFEFAISKFRQHKYFFNTVYSYCFITVTKAFLIYYYKVCQ